MHCVSTIQRINIKQPTIHHLNLLIMLLSTILEAVSYVPGLAALSAAIAVIGAAFGIGKIGQSAMEAMARQPEAAGRIQSGMIIIGALVEGATFFALIVCLLAVLG